ncbi:UDP-galactose translocator-like isoform X1 [Artemia franciscana]|uniref:UDP-galactose translocator-like isoform X1 n=2 Tax=Artemia franciscana TaxID=6661 RepID=UPI0032DA24CE
MIENSPEFYKYVSLVVLTVQNATVGLSMRYARIRPGEMFLSSTAVVMSELVKLFTCLLIVFKEEDSSLGKVKIAIHEQIIRQPMDTLKVCIPSLIYVVQNNLLYLAASNLDAATYQVTYQLKILTAALFTVTILRRKLISTQWLSLVVLVTGVALVQLADQPTKPGEANANQSKVIGFSAAIAACFLSGFAGIYFEKILKGSNVSVWMRNIQLSFLSLPFGLVTCVINDYTQLKEKGFFYGYDGFVWYLVVLQATGGLIVAAVVKYADNILKGFATSLAIILSCIASVYIFDFHLTLQFAFGTSLVIGSVFLYGYVPRTHNRVKVIV